MADNADLKSPIESIKIQVLFFAVARELAETSNAQVLLPLNEDGFATTLNLRQYIALQYPKLAEQVDTITLAVNKEYLEDDKDIPLKDGDEVALIPPISGG